jgi:hypothetical protein
MVRFLFVAALMLALVPATALADENSLHQVAPLGDLTLEYWLAPGVTRPTAVELHLADAAGRAPTDVRRVDVQFAMAGMNHGARGLEAEMVEPGVYQTAGYLLAMQGSWWMAVRVERADGRLHQARFAFATTPEPPTNAASALDGRPDGAVQVVDVVASPGETIPDQVAVTAGRPVRVEAMFVDNPGCGPSVAAPDAGARADVTPDRLAELTFTPPLSAQLTVTCAPEGIVLR